MDVFSAVGPEVQTKSACSGPGEPHTHLDGEEPVGCRSFRVYPPGGQPGPAASQGSGMGRGMGSELCKPCPGMVEGTGVASPGLMGVLCWEGQRASETREALLWERPGQMGCVGS